MEAARSATPAAVQEQPSQSAESSHRPIASIRSFTATVSLNPGLSVGTTDPESIYTARLNAQFEASNPHGNGDCEVLLPLPPQIISLADLEVTATSIALTPRPCCLVARCFSWSRNGRETQLTTRKFAILRVAHGR